MGEIPSGALGMEWMRVEGKRINVEREGGYTGGEWKEGYVEIICVKYLRDAGEAEALWNRSELWRLLVLSAAFPKRFSDTNVCLSRRLGDDEKHL